MKIAKVRIKGTSSLLLHRFSMEPTDNSKKDNQYNAEDEVKKHNYFDEEIGCYVPSTQIEASMREAGKNFKNGRASCKALVESSVFCEEEKIPLNKREPDEVDTRPVCIMRNKIIRHRPKYVNWQLTFHLRFDSDRLTAEKVKNILAEAGAVKGIGDYRPKFGRFTVEEFEVLG